MASSGNTMSGGPILAQNALPDSRNMMFFLITILCHLIRPARVASKALIFLDPIQKYGTIFFMTKKIVIAALMAGAAMLMSAAPSQAAELVSNGGFETGDFTGWTQFGNSAWDAVRHFGFAGSHAAYFGPVERVGGISQSLATVVGQTYNISFALANDGGSPTSFSADFGGSNLMSQSDAPSFDYTVYNFTRTATSASTTLSFTFLQDPSFYNLDSVSVTGTTGAVPEPATWAMMIFGLGAAGATMRRRKVATALRFA